MTEPTIDTTTDTTTAKATMAAPSPAPATAQGPQLRDFEDAIRTKIDKAMGTGHGPQIAPLVLLLIGAGADTWLGLLPYPLGTVLPIVLACMVVVGAPLITVGAYRVGLVTDVDWTTADAYEKHLTASLPPAVRVVLSSAQRKVRGRIPAAAGMHLYIMRPCADHQNCTIDAGGCSCARRRLSAALVPSRRHPVLVIGERLLEIPEVLAFVLAHEAHHARRAARTLHLLVRVPLPAGWLALGLAVSPHQVMLLAPALWLVTTALCWGDELLADLAATRVTGPDAAREYWTRVQRAFPRPTGPARAWGAIGWLLASHPPIPLRLALAARITGPPSRTPRL